MNRNRTSGGSTAAVSDQDVDIITLPALKPTRLRRGESREQGMTAAVDPRDIPLLLSRQWPVVAHDGISPPAPTPGIESGSDLGG
jgi:hypothetical protein